MVTDAAGTRLQTADPDWSGLVLGVQMFRSSQVSTRSLELGPHLDPWGNLSLATTEGAGMVFRCTLEREREL